MYCTINAENMPYRLMQKLLNCPHFHNTWIKSWNSAYDLIFVRRRMSFCLIILFKDISSPTTPSAFPAHIVRHNSASYFCGSMSKIKNTCSEFEFGRNLASPAKTDIFWILIDIFIRHTFSMKHGITEYSSTENPVRTSEKQDKKTEKERD